MHRIQWGGGGLGPPPLMGGDIAVGCFGVSTLVVMLAPVYRAEAARQDIPLP